MRSIGKIFIATALLLTAFSLSPSATAQNFYLGVSGSTMVHTWFSATSAPDNHFTANGWGRNLGAFLRFGKKPYFQFGIDWIWMENDFSVRPGNDIEYSENIRANNFDFSIKIGYNIVKTPIFKYQIHAGPFLGRSTVFPGKHIGFKSDDVNNSQSGFIAGTGIQFTNLIIDFEYTFRFTQLFNTLIVDGQTVDLQAKPQLIALKAGFMF